MKKITYLAIILSFSLYSCSSDDDGIETEETQNYFPLVTTNSWAYSNTFTIGNQQDSLYTETIVVKDSIVSNNSIAYDLELNNLVSTSVMSIICNQGLFTKSDNFLSLTGELSLELEQLPELNINIENVPLYDIAQENGTVLYSAQNSIEQEIQSIPITISYELTTMMGESFSSFEVNDMDFEDVISSTILVNMQVTASISSPFPANITLLEAQDVLSVTNFFARDVGLIQSKSTINLDFVEIEMFPLEDISTITEQEITQYSVILD